MAFTKDQREPNVPTSNVDNRETSDLLPRYYRTSSNKKFLQGTLDQLTQPGTVKKISGYLGRNNAKAVTSKDIFLAASDDDRQSYQLEPAAIVKDYLGNTTFFKDYIDHMNHIKVFDGITENHSRVNKQEFYSWNPHICWDKFTNFQQYYWLPFGPESVEIFGQTLDIISEYTVSTVNEGDNVAYLFDPKGPTEGLVRNPVLRLFRGQTYVFDISSDGHPFSIKTSRVADTIDRYTIGVSENAIENGKLTFTVPENAPDVLFYVSENAVDTGGVFQILDITESTEINVVADIIGKKSYIIPNGTASGLKLSNGMKLSFSGNVTPSEYSTGFWYVEGVGLGIKLVSEISLEIRSTYTQEQSLLFDDIPFDQMPFSEVGTFPSKKDYITINRSSIDNNPWSRYNRWFHKDVIEISASANGNIAEFDQTARATRPIIEFNPNIKLHNYGVTSKANVDVIDNYTTDAFSTVEGSIGYNIDGIDLVDGMRVLFNADTDSMVRSKIFKVNFIEVLVPSSQLSFNAGTDIRTETSTIVFPSEHGLSSGNQVTYLEHSNSTISELVNRQVYYVKVINQFTIALYKNKELTKQVYIYHTGTGNYSLELFIGYRKQIQLTEELDSMPMLYESVSVRFGINDLVGGIKGNQGQNYWYTGSTWKLSQLKLSVNQPPLFDIFDSDGYSYSDITKYNGSNFNGNKIFSYKEGTGSPDTELKFPLTHKNINNVGDIVFDFNLLNSSIAYNTGLVVSYKNTDVGYLMLSRSLTSRQFVNGWTLNKIENSQPIIRVFKNIESFPVQNISDQETYTTTDGVIYTFNKLTGLWKTDTFPIDVFSDKDDLADLEVKVYINGKRVNKQYLDGENVYSPSYKILDGVVKKFVKLLSVSATETDVVSLKCISKQVKNNNGHYEIPINLQNNPLNDNISQFTLGEVIDHVDTIIDNINNFQGIYPGNNNIRDLGNISGFGTRFVQHSGPLNLALYHLGSKSANLVKALDKARNEYGQFKRAFLVAANNSGIDLDAKRHVDYILQEMNKDKPSSQAYYLSDMFGYTAVNRLEINVLDSRIKVYPLTDIFNLKTLSNKAVNVYLNDTQLIYGRDYTFGDTEFFTVLTDLVENDILEIYEYATTDGCFCPPTPTKLGIFPKFEPKRYVDNSYIDPTEVIQGHDGSITVAFGDYRDELILELEKRIFNNIKVSYDPSIFDIYNFIPGNDRVTAYTLDEFDSVLSKYFFQWTLNISEDYTKHTGYNRENSFTLNYGNSTTPDGTAIKASWRGIYKQLLDTDVPHIKPWECLGFSIEPNWWENTYGPSPYTSDNLILWDDIKSGIIREPGVPVRRNPKFAKSIIAYGKPVDENGVLLSPLDAGFATGYINYGDSGNFVFGDQAPVETAWRRSSYYAFAVLEACLLLAPNDVLARCFDRSRIVKNLDNQLVYSETNLRIRLEDIKVPSTANRNSGERVSTCGLINYVVDYLTSENTSRIDDYASDLSSLTNNISTRLGGFTSKPKYKLLLDSKSPNSSGGVFVPEENYSVELNISSAIDKVIYSGVIVTKYSDGFEVKGYTFDNPYFDYYSFRADDRIIRVGGISESYLIWSAGKTYVAGKVILADNTYYRVKITHVSEETFNSSYYARLPELPIVGGHSAIIKKYCDKSTVNRISYGTRLPTIQDVADLLQGYGAYLEDRGFVFSDFNNATSDISNWETSLKEFLFWVSQGWSVGAAISLSPVANKVVFTSSSAVVDSLIDPFYGYNVYKVDGTKLDPEFITVYRSGNEFVIEPENTEQGIYGLTLYLVQKEHIIVLDDTTLFNDTIYSKSTGYRQERIKALGYITTAWNGGFEIPGFIYDKASVTSWNSWTDYNLGDIVKYKEFYYSAKRGLPGVETFKNSDWVLLDSKPKSELLPNWDYRAEQFTDFYDLDTDNFDSEQQRMAQHLVGYQKRQYLENIINNDVSQYKFYQGMIAEKGTHNVLNKLFDVLSADAQESLTFDEEWAFRVGEYGAIDTFNEIEFILDDGMFKTQPQPLELVDYVDTSILDYVYRQLPSDLYVKPIGITTDIWKKKQSTDYLRTPGYVRKENVKANIDIISDLISVDISTFKEGDYVWTAFEPTGWNVYRLTKSEYKIIDAVYDSQHVVTLFLNSPVDYPVGTVIGIENSILKGFHVVTEVLLNKVSFTAVLTGFQEFTDSDTIIFYVMTSQRIKSVDNINSVVTSRLKKNELVWADDNGNSRWSVYKNTPVYSRGEIPNATPSLGLKFGSAIAMSANGDCAAVSDNDYITVYIKGSSDNNWGSIQRIPRINSNSIVMQFSKDGAWLIVSDPAKNSNNGYVAIYKQNKTRLYNFEFAVNGTASEKLGSNISIANYSSGYMLVITSTTEIQVYTYTHSWVKGTAIAVPINIEFGYDIALSNSGTLVISAPASNIGTVFVYNFIDSEFVPSMELPKIAGNADDRFGETVSISESGKYIAVGSTLTDTGLQLDTGRVYVYELTTSGEYIFVQEIVSVYTEANERFGTNIEFMNDDASLVIFSLNGDGKYVYELSDGTTFDNNTLRIIDTLVDVGRVDIYDRYDTKFVYGETLQQVSTKSTDYGKQLAVGRNTILVSAVNATDNGYKLSGTTYSYIKPPDTTSWMPLHTQSYRVDVSTIKKAFLYNKVTNQIVKYLDVVDPTLGKIPGLADQEIKFKTYFDPATYSVGTENVTVDDGLSWTSAQVGMLWWDLSKAKFLDTESGDAVYKTSVWNKLYDTASIDIYEWVESTLLPEAWNDRVGTEEGATLNITGQTKYDDNVYSVKRKFDNVSQSFKNTYYFWVKNKLTTPAVDGRLISASNVSKLIEDPQGYGYTCLAFTDSNSVSLVNVDKYLENKNVVLSIQYWTSPNRDSNYHSQWKLLSTNKNTVIPSQLEEKWFHSLIGKDSADRTLPDTSLPEKYRYGIEFRPRQSMFINRIEALKQYFERVNASIASILLVDDYDLSDLERFEPAPSAVTGKWDLVKDTDKELRFVSTIDFILPKLSPVINDNGEVIGITIVEPGRGYIGTRSYNPDNNAVVSKWYGPSISISGVGRYAELKTIINSAGSVVGVDISNSGEGYTSNTTLAVRGFTVLTLSDTGTDGWALYSWNLGLSEWQRVKAQSYNVNNYWNYIDWYATGYTQYTKIDYLVESTYELVTTDIPLNSVVKVKNIGSGGWVLLEKYNTVETIDYTVNFRVIGRKNGTIKFLSTIYNPNTGFDKTLSDSTGYDVYPVEELRIILNTIKTKILVDELRTEYLKLFFASVRYVMYEQVFVDWVFKTSFVKAMHNIGELKQKVTYNSDNLEFFEDYIKEVKPYRTKVREYVSNYNKLDLTRTSVTDFDLLPVIDSNFNVSPLTAYVTDDGAISSSFSELLTDPWNHWNTVLGFEITSIMIVDQGANYVTRPTVKIEGIQLGNGKAAEAKAYITNGKVNRIVLVTGGTKWTKAPTVTLVGGLAAGGSPAKAIAIIGNSLIKSTYIKVKFDRVSKVYQVTNLESIEEFSDYTIVSGSRTQFPLRWSPNTERDTYSIVMNGTEVLKNEYYLKPVTQLSEGYTKYSGILVFNEPPSSGSTITVKYHKNFDHLEAVDRINFYYNPSTGQTGKDLSQLMTGIDYGGVIVTGTTFGTNYGWHASSWDATNTQDFDDAIFEVISTSNNTFKLQYIPKIGQVLNIYVSHLVDGIYKSAIRIDDISYLTINQSNTNAVMSSFIGDGEIDIITVPETALSVGDRVIIRKIESDGRTLLLDADYDTKLTGGDLAYVSATGISPDDIILDGDGFLSPMTSHAPEEIVPGHVMDTLAIKVYSRPTGGCPNILFKNYIGDSETRSFIIGQYFPNNNSVIVKVGNNVLTLDTDYIIEYQTNAVTFAEPPAFGSDISILSISFNSANVLDVDYFIANGEATDYITKAPWMSTVKITVLVNGKAVAYSFFNTTDAGYTDGSGLPLTNILGIRFPEPPTNGAVINYIIDNSDTEQSASIVKSEIFTYNSGILNYELVNPVGVNLPLEANVLVKANGMILVSPSYSYFNIEKSRLIYGLADDKYQNTLISATNILVYVNGKLKTVGLDYNVIFNAAAAVSIELTPEAYADGEGAMLVVGTTITSDYILDSSNSIRFTKPLADGTTVEVISFYNHNILGIDRLVNQFSQVISLTPGTPTYYDFSYNLGGIFTLPHTALSGDFIWVIKNGQLLTHRIDYYLESDFRTVRLVNTLDRHDVVQLVAFTNAVVMDSFGFMQFKDMMNRTHYKRLNKHKSTVLAQGLQQFDLEIHVADGGNLDTPNVYQNIPGIIEINGERIEYFIKDGNILRQLRRATLGTGAPEMHFVGTIVQGLGVSETIPYKDAFIIEIGDKKDNDGNAIYPDLYTLGKMEFDFELESDAIEVFVGGFRLKKSAYVLYANTAYPYSPEGDIVKPTEFTVTGKILQLTNLPIDLLSGTQLRVVVVKKQGKLWNDIGSRLGNSDNVVANFIKETEASWPSLVLQDKY